MFGKIKLIRKIIKWSWIIGAVTIFFLGIGTVFFLDGLGSDDGSSSGSIGSGTVSGFVQYYQSDYPDTPCGGGTIATSGCGQTSFAMIASTILGKKITPEDAVNWCGNKYYVPGAGTSWEYFAAAKEHFEVGGTMTETESIDDVASALKDGALVISSQGQGLFTAHGHFIVLSGIDGDDKISVKDPNKNNAINKGYNDRKFSKEEIAEAAQHYWIFTF